MWIEKIYYNKSTVKIFHKFNSSMVTLIVAEDEENCLESDKYKRMIVRKNINLYEQKLFIVLYLIINEINETDKKIFER